MLVKIDKWCGHTEVLADLADIVGYVDSLVPHACSMDVHVHVYMYVYV